MKNSLTAEAIYLSEVRTFTIYDNYGTNSSIPAEPANIMIKNSSSSERQNRHEITAMPLLRGAFFLFLCQSFKLLSLVFAKMQMSYKLQKFDKVRFCH